jgi:hypothetical protein
MEEIVGINWRQVSEIRGQVSSSSSEYSELELLPLLRRAAETVLEVADEEIDFLFRAAAGIAVALLEKHYQVVPAAVDLIQVLGTQFGPEKVQFGFALVPLKSKNIVLHDDPLSKKSR